MKSVSVLAVLALFTLQCFAALQRPRARDVDNEEGPLSTPIFYENFNELHKSLVAEIIHCQCLPRGPSSFPPTALVSKADDPGHVTQGVWLRASKELIEKVKKALSGCGCSTSTDTGPLPFSDTNESPESLLLISSIEQKLEVLYARVYRAIIKCCESKNIKPLHDTFQENPLHSNEPVWYAPKDQTGDADQGAYARE